MCNISPRPESFNYSDLANYPITNQRLIPSYYKKHVTWPQLYVELAIIFDRSMYVKHGQDVARLYEVSQYLMQLVNYFYEPLNIKFALVDIDVWTSDALFPYDLGDILKTVDRFRNFTTDQLFFKSGRKYDAISLISSQVFKSGSVGGGAIVGGMCGFQTSAVIILEYSTNKLDIALTMAHELGHLFDMYHDDESHGSCECQNQRCIMHSTTTDDIRYWSACGLANMSRALAHGAMECLMNKPERLFTDNHRDYISCGDGIVDKREECDCAASTMLPNIVLPPAMSCQNKCCNQSTCRFAPGFKCSAGQCCNDITCQFQPQSVQCRSVVDECDFPEFCDGKSSTCPPDAYKQDGLPCRNGISQCYKGHCGPVDKCKLYLNINGDQTDEKCYGLNQRGDLGGNCGYLMNGSFIQCAMRDSKCGMLQCNGELRRSSDSYCGLAWHARATYRFTYRSQSEIVCFMCHAFLMPPSGSNWSDYGYVADGTSCGNVNEKRVCYKQKCLKIDQVLSLQGCRSSCGTNGICTNLGRCSCSPGYSGTLCEIKDEITTTKAKIATTKAKIKTTKAKITEDQITTSKVEMTTTEDEITTTKTEVTKTKDEITTKNDDTKENHEQVWTIPLTAAICIIIFMVIFAILVVWCVSRKKKNENKRKSSVGKAGPNFMFRNVKSIKNKKVFWTATVPLRKLFKGKRNAKLEKQWYKQHGLVMSRAKKIKTRSIETHDEQVQLSKHTKSIDRSSSSDGVFTSFEYHGQ